MQRMRTLNIILAQGTIFIVAILDFILNFPLTLDLSKMATTDFEINRYMN